MKKEKKAKKGVGFLKMIEWQSRAASHGIVILLLGYLTIYCTDTLKMNPIVVGTLLAVSKVIDGITDLFAGFIVDRTHTKWGKGRPYEWCIVGMWLCTWLMFSASPEWSGVIKGIWIFWMYSLVNAVFYTMLNANGNVYMVRAFKTQDEYVALNTYGGIIPMLTAFAFNIAFPVAMAKIATSPAGWSRLVAVIAVPLAAFGMLRFLTIKETHEVEAVSATEKISLKDVGMILKHNRYIYILAIATLVMNFVTNMGINTYYFTYRRKCRTAGSPVGSPDCYRSADVRIPSDHPEVFQTEADHGGGHHHMCRSVHQLYRRQQHDTPDDRCSATECRRRTDLHAGFAAHR